MSVVDVYGYSVFCDDVRQEVNAKQSFMGVYPNAMSIHGTFPASIPKLCISIYFCELQALAEKRDWIIPIAVFGPGESFDNPALKGELPAPDENYINSLKNFPKYANADELYAVANINISFIPLLIKEPGWLKVRARYNDRIIRLGSIRVDPGPIPQPT